MNWCANTIFSVMVGNLKKNVFWSLKSLIGLVIQGVRPNHFSKKLLKYIFMKLDFINIWWIT